MKCAAIAIPCLFITTIVGCRAPTVPPVDAAAVDAVAVDGREDGGQSAVDSPALVDSVDAGSDLARSDASTPTGDDADGGAEGWSDLGSDQPDLMDVSAGTADVGFGDCSTSDGSVWRVCGHCTRIGQLYGFYCSPADAGPCYVYPNTCVDPGFVDCLNGSDTVRFPGLRARCADLCARLRIEGPPVACEY